jgi:hypothetical protein
MDMLPPAHADSRFPIPRVSTVAYRADEEQEACTLHGTVELWQTHANLFELTYIYTYVRSPDEKMRSDRSHHLTLHV